MVHGKQAPGAIGSHTPGGVVWQEMGAVIYDPSLHRSTGPRKMNVYVPNVMGDEEEELAAPVVQDILKSVQSDDHDGLLHLINKPVRACLQLNRTLKTEVSSFGCAPASMERHSWRLHVKFQRKSYEGVHQELLAGESRR